MRSPSPMRNTSPPSSDRTHWANSHPPTPGVSRSRTQACGRKSVTSTSASEPSEHPRGVKPRQSECGREPLGRRGVAVGAEDPAARRRHGRGNGHPRQEGAGGAAPPAAPVPGTAEDERGGQVRFRGATAVESIEDHRRLLRGRAAAGRRAAPGSPGRRWYRQPIDLGEVVGGGPGTTTPRREGSVRRRFGRTGRARGVHHTRRFGRTGNYSVRAGHHFPSGR